MTGDASAVWCAVSNKGLFSSALKIEPKDSFSSKDTELRRMNSASDFTPGGQDLKNKK